MSVRLGISACLLGERVRWDGDHRREPLLADVFGRHVEWVPVCPEVELGLGIPREPIRLEGDVRRPRLVGVTSRIDHTAAMTALADERVRQLAGWELGGYVLKSGSPSCGMSGVGIQRSGRRPGRGTGLFARRLVEGLPLLPVEDERRLRDPALRAAFVERVLAHARWQRAAAAGMTRRRLADFHAEHALLLLAHDPAGHRRLARLLRDGSGRPARTLAARYATGFMQALGRPATRARHARVLRTVLSRLSGRLPPAERRRLRARVASYRRGRTTLAAALEPLRRHAERLGDGELCAQAYLDPHPLRDEPAVTGGSRASARRRRSRPSSSAPSA
jgi:uncharacterized protein YbbK (DUF523 family)/uncharacterized protein YbgA (DUF1722 family)